MRHCVDKNMDQFSKVNIIFYLQDVFRKNTANNWGSSGNGGRLWGGAVETHTKKKGISTGNCRILDD